MTKINALPPGFEEPPRGRGQADVANQHESWLRQMELAQMAGMNQAGAPQAPAAPAAVHAAVARAPMAPAVHAAHAATPRPQRTTEQAHEQERGQEHARAKADAGPSAAPAAVQAPAAPRSAPAPAPQAFAYAVVAPPPAALTAMPAGAAPARAAGAADSGAMPASATPRAGLAAILPGAMAQQGSAPSAAPDAGEEAPHAASEQRPAADAPRDFQKRMMHLTGSGQDVKLWLRDSALGQAQSLELVYRMAGDMAAMGLRLKGATINGKPALPAEPHDARADSLDAALPAPITELDNHHGA